MLLRDFFFFFFWGGGGIFLVHTNDDTIRENLKIKLKLT